jgi:formylglycine-generating enzyme required for sulfatase activity/DNA-binding CsgD family transcriptional regulator
MANRENIVLLSKHQMRVLYYKCKEGLTHAEIAEKLDREVNTIQYHMTNIYAILEIKETGKSKNEMDSELKNEICSIIRGMFSSYEDINIWAPQLSYKPPPSVERILRSDEDQPIPPEILEPPPPGRRRINWWLVFGGMIITLSVIVLLSIIGKPENPNGILTTAAALSVLPSPTRTHSPSPSPISTSTVPPNPTQTHSLLPTPSPTSTPIDIITEISDFDGMVLVKIPEGEFKMGSTRSEDPQTLDEEIPQHVVYLDTYWIDQTEVTNEQYASCVASGACARPVNNYSSSRESYYANIQYADYPVIFVSWNQAAAYCDWAERRLPTEAEWEKAAGGSNEYIYPWGNTFDGTLTNYCDINCQWDWRDDSVDDGYIDTSPVGDYPGGASMYEVLDMVGNVYEWVADWYEPYRRDSLTNPTGPVSGVDKIIRGGSWGDDPAHVRSTVRSPINPDNWMDFIGFRCAR